jgi:excinuclease ABC subunit C
MVTLMSLRQKLNRLPSQPGVYILKGGQGRILYIGKAKVLRNRLRSYFQGTPTHPRLRVLISKVADFETVVTDTEVEALILEANLIRLHRPRYNVNLKDDKRYPFLKVTVNEPYPRLLIVRRRKPDGARYFGPYTNVKAMRATLRTLRKIFPIRTCSFPLPSSRSVPVCLDYHINRCLGPCQGMVSHADYRRMIESVCLFLSGKKAHLAALLRRQMLQAAERKNFELAAQLRDQLFALEAVMRRQKVVSPDLVDRDVLAYAAQDHRACGVILQIREGSVIARQHFYVTVPSISSASDVISALIRRHYADATLIPEEILVSHELDDMELIQRWLRTNRAKKVTIRVPQRGQKAKLVRMASENARHLLRETMVERQRRKARPSAPVAGLQKELGLAEAPGHIQAFDISNILGQDAVGSMVVFRNGRTAKKEYRRFKVKSVPGQNDFAMMAEVIGRRFQRLLREDRELPDLVVVDGGKGQLSSARKALVDLGISEQPMVGLAKRMDELFLPNRRDAFMIPKSSPALKLLQRIRDEAHRFAVQYHRKLREGRLRGSELEAIAGIGRERSRRLLNHFGSLKRLKASSREELSAVPGLGRKLARRVYEHLHGVGSV